MVEAKSPRYGFYIAMLALTGLAAWAGTFFTLGPERITSLWLTNAFALALLLRIPRRMWPATIAAIGVMTATIWIVSTGLALQPIGLTFATCVDIALAALMMDTPRITAMERGSPRYLGNLILRAGMLAPLGSMPIALLVVAGHGGSLFNNAQDWLVAHSLGMISIGPLLMALNGDSIRSLRHPRHAVEALGIVVGTALLTVVIFTQGSYPTLFFIFAALIVAVFRLGFAGAAITIAVTTITVALMTNAGYGPIAGYFADIRERVTFFQIFIATAALTVLPIAALLEERKRLTARAEERSRQLELGESVAHVGHWRVALGADETYWSDEVFRLHGLPPVSGMMNLERAINFFHEDDRQKVVEILQRPIETGQIYDVTGRIVRPSGEIRHVRLRGLPEYNEDGTPIGLFGVGIDITESVEAERALIEARRQAEESAQAKDRFIATISHEIRTPMTGVMGMIELLDSDPPEAERKRYLETLGHSASVLMGLLDQILDLSKISNRNITLEPIDFELGSLVENTVNLYLNSASSKGIALEIQYPAPRPTMIHADQTRLAQVLSNLVNNAVKYTDKGLVSVVVTPPSEDPADIVWTFDVCDTGAGINTADLPRIFAPFEQLATDSSQSMGGIGLGLAISRSIVTAMGGTITVNSTVGEGTCFKVKLPLPPATDEGAADGAAEPAAPSRPLDILLAEDNAVNQLLVATLLRRAGHNVTVVSNGLQAVRAAADQRFDAIFMDMQMPEMDGIAATREIRASGNAVPIIALTADASVERRRNYTGIGLSDFIAKPVSLARLQQSLANLEAPPGVVVPTEANDAPAGAPVLDPLVIDELRPLVGEEKLHRLLDLLRTEAERMPPVVADHLKRGAVTEARRACHALRGAATSMGAHALADACRAIETEPTIVRIAVLEDAAARTIATIDALRAESSATA